MKIGDVAEASGLTAKTIRYTAYAHGSGSINML